MKTPNSEEHRIPSLKRRNAAAHPPQRLAFLHCRHLLPKACWKRYVRDLRVSFVKGLFGSEVSVSPSQEFQKPFERIPTSSKPGNFKKSARHIKSVTITQWVQVPNILELWSQIPLRAWLLGPESLMCTWTLWVMKSHSACTSMPAATISIRNRCS